ncbi:hypothetical protein [Lactovum miscens]|uniref:Uncharacterized protein n=1 Tax=Lactovum miscens TaxID=190387 RepID=A0A841C817_9LACT|nr:hypothetical protein [Lactovum miscens]MBB5888635.1 hypothetical protein [Lactovum miscens]
MYKNIFGLFTVLLGVICVVLTIESIRKKRWGLAVFFILNAFTNLVNSIHAFFGSLF